MTLFACAPTCEDVEGAICADELAEMLEADTGLDGGWAWFDAEGRQVTIDAELLWEDDDGVIWQVDPVRASPFALLTDSPASYPWFESDNCSGDALGVLVPAPHWAYVGNAEDPIRVWRGGDVTMSVRLQSRTYNGECSEFGRTEDVVVRWDDIDVLATTPSPEWVGPLRLQPL